MHGHFLPRGALDMHLLLESFRNHIGRALDRETGEKETISRLHDKKYSIRVENRYSFN